MAVAFVVALPHGGMWPLVLFALAAGSDYVDGPLARRAGAASRHGVLLDAGADIAFVLAGTGAGVATGRLSWIVPAAILGAAVPFVVATVRRSRTVGRPERAFSVVGHAAGVVNYVIVGLVAGSVAVPGPRWPGILLVVSVVTVGLNLTALVLRFRRPPAAPRAPAPGSTIPGAHSSPRR